MDFELEKGIVSETPDSTKALAKRIAESMGFKGCIALSGDLGAGKTVFAKGLAEALGIKVPVKSPSYNVCITYEGAIGNFAHVDAYRLKGPDDFDALLIDEILADPKLVCVEWPQIVKDALPEGTLHLEISIIGESDSRLIRTI